MRNNIKAEKIIRKLAMRGQDERQILQQLEKRGLLNDSHTEMIRKIIREYRAAQAFLPRQPPRKRIKTFGVILIVSGVFLQWHFKDLDTHGLTRGHPAAYGFWVMIAGIFFFFFPEKALEKW